VIGGGSGGLACAKRAASYGARVAVVEGKAYGGTCVNVGCVPKKVMFNAASVAETIKDAKEFGFTVGDVSFDWGSIKRYRDRYIQRLNGIYESGLDKVKITRFQGFASFEDKNTLALTSSSLTSSDDAAALPPRITAKHIVVAVGGKPNTLGVPGEEHVIDSDGFFALETQPKKVGVLGAGYIAVELAGVFHGLGSETSLFVRGDKALRAFDTMISTQLDKTMKHSGINVVSGSVSKEVTKEADGTFTLHLENGEVVFTHFSSYLFLNS
jgi:glutathione reductase (NADPH)